jgi:hypothetical protein
VLDPHSNAFPMHLGDEPQVTIDCIRCGKTRVPHLKPFRSSGVSYQGIALAMPQIARNEMPL